MVPAPGQEHPRGNSSAFLASQQHSQQTHISLLSYFLPLKVIFHQNINLQIKSTTAPTFLLQASQALFAFNESLPASLGRSSHETVNTARLEKPLSAEPVSLRILPEGQPPLASLSVPHLPQPCGQP